MEATQRTDGRADAHRQTVASLLCVIGLPLRFAHPLCTARCLVQTHSTALHCTALQCGGLDSTECTALLLHWAGMRSLRPASPQRKKRKKGWAGHCRHIADEQRDRRADREEREREDERGRRQDGEWMEAIRDRQRWRLQLSAIRSLAGAQFNSFAPPAAAALQCCPDPSTAAAPATLAH